jgi:pimeloyl-ACP methyl ester carboxylesterase
MGNIILKTLHHRGVDLKYRTAGNGPVLVLLHGANGSMSLLPIVEELAEKFQIILPDHPGFGDTKQADWISSISDLAYFYLDIIETMDLDDIHLLGHSMGGWIAAEMAICNSHNIKSLTLVSSAGIAVEGTPMGDLFSWSPKEAASQVFAQKEFVDQMLAHEPSKDELAVMQKNRQMAMLLCQKAQFQNPDLKKWLHRLRKPTLILWGDSDGIFPEPFAHAYHDLVPNSDLEIYKDCGHVPMVEARKEFLERLIDFMVKAG